MEFVSLLLIVSARSLGLAAAAWTAMKAVRVQSPAVRHAIWTLVTAGMLAIGVASVGLPPLPVRVLRPRVPAPPVAATTVVLSAPVRIPARAPEKPFSWPAVYAAGVLLFGGRLAYGYALARGLVSGSGRVPQWDNVYASDRVQVPLTVGWLRPKILLPADWEQWGAEKLEAVLVHERNHVRREDWAVAMLAGVNRCVFWFHPLAWWLEARLSVLAEQACDDASLTQVASPEGYAQVLVEMAAALRDGKGRAGREAMAMAKRADVRMRIERILDENRPVFPAMTQKRWIVLAVCAVPVVYLMAVARPARVRAEVQATVPVAAPQAAAQQEPQRDQPAHVQQPPAPQSEPQPVQSEVARDLIEQERQELLVRLAQLQAQLQSRLQYLEAQRQYHLSGIEKQSE
jgi:hypothetical protein